MFRYIRKKFRHEECFYHIFYASALGLIFFLFQNITENSKKAENGVVVEKLDRIRIVFAVWTFLIWVFLNFTDTEGAIKDLILRRATLKRVSHIRKHFRMSRKSICRSFYCSEFLGNLVGSDFDCYSDQRERKGPLDMDEMAHFDDVMGRKR